MGGECDVILEQLKQSLQLCNESVEKLYTGSEIFKIIKCILRFPVSKNRLGVIYSNSFNHAICKNYHILVEDNGLQNARLRQSETLTLGLLKGNSFNVAMCPTFKCTHSTKK
ncbi:hypothetical protein Trydic_g7333 [Trypoxylus dichotomus]